MGEDAGIPGVVRDGSPSVATADTSPVAMGCATAGCYHGNLTYFERALAAEPRTSLKG